MVNRILVATDGSESANRAIDYAAQRAKAESAELLIANVMGGYGLPDKALIAFADDRNILLNELLETQSAHTLAVARERAHRAGAGTVMVESRHGEIAKTIIGHREGNERRHHRRRQARHGRNCRIVAGQRLAKTRGSLACATDGRSIKAKRGAEHGALAMALQARTVEDLMITRHVRPLAAEGGEIRRARIDETRVDHATARPA